MTMHRGAPIVLYRRTHCGLLAASLWHHAQRRLGTLGEPCRTSTLTKHLPARLGDQRDRRGDS
jgi:hypothetical protein